MFHDGQPPSQLSWRELSTRPSFGWDDDAVPTEVSDANDWIRRLDEVEPNNLRWRRRVETALRCMRDGLLQKDLELSALSGPERQQLDSRIPGLRLQARSALVKIGVLLSGLTSLNPRDVEHGLARVGRDVADFLDTEADAYLHLEAALQVPAQALRRAKIGI